MFQNNSITKKFLLKSKTIMWLKKRLRKINLFYKKNHIIIFQIQSKIHNNHNQSKNLMKIFLKILWISKKKQILKMIFLMIMFSKILQKINLMLYQREIFKVKRKWNMISKTNNKILSTKTHCLMVQIIQQESMMKKIKTSLKLKILMNQI